MDDTLKLPISIYVVAVFFFTAPGIALLILRGSHSSAFPGRGGQALRGRPGSRPTQ
jgi:hypothetical protein